jgi:hypothetical protein
MYYIVCKETNKVIDKCTTLVLADCLAQDWIIKGVDVTIVSENGEDLGVETT